MCELKIGTQKTDSVFSSSGKKIISGFWLRQERFGEEMLFLRDIMLKSQEGSKSTRAYKKS